MNVRQIVFCALGLCLLSNAALANPMKKFPVPVRTQVWWVTKGNVHNGHEVFIKKFATKQSPQSVVDFYQNVWQTNGDVPGYRQSTMGDWQLISKLTGEYQWVVQIRPSDSGRGSEGVLSAMRLTGNTLSRTPGILRNVQFTESVRGGDLLSSTEASEPSFARTQLHLYPERPSRVANRFKSHMASMGWSLQDEHTHQGSVTQRFEKALRQIDVAIVEHNRSKALLFLNEVINNER